MSTPAGDEPRVPDTAAHEPIETVRLVSVDDGEPSPLPPEAPAAAVDPAPLTSPAAGASAQSPDAVTAAQPAFSAPPPSAPLAPEPSTVAQPAIAGPPPPPAAAGPAFSPPPPTAPPPAPPMVSPPAGGSSRPRWLAVAIAGGAMFVAAIAAVLALTVFSSSGEDHSTAYQDKVAVVITPVISANTRLSTSLQALRGTRPSQARRLVKAAQAATLSARGGVAALTVPSGSGQLATNARATLTREAAYLSAVGAALADPASASASQTQTLAGNLTGALDVIAPAQKDWSQSVAGADTLTSWAPKAAATIKRREAAAAARRRQRARGTQNPAASSPGPRAPAGGSDCGGGTHAGPNTSCSFAQNVRDAYNQAPGATASVQVYSPVTNQTYTMSCAPAGTGVTCSGGNNASVTW